MEIVTHEAVGHTLFDPDALINHNDGEVISLTIRVFEDTIPYIFSTYYYFSQGTANT